MAETTAAGQVDRLPLLERVHPTSAGELGFLGLLRNMGHNKSP
jgi:hypothetical protein